MCRASGPNARYDESIMTTATFGARGRWLRFSLRTLLVAVTIFCVWLGLKVNAARRQREAVAAMERAGATVIFDYQLMPVVNAAGRMAIDANSIPPGPAWLRNLFGDDFFRTVMCVRLDNRHIADSDFARLADFSKLSALCLDGTRIVRQAGSESPIQDQDLAALEGLTRLEHLDLRNSQVSGSSLLHCLGGLKQIRHLELSDTHVDDEALQWIGARADLEYLAIDGTRITDNGLASLRGCRNLQTLDIGNTDVSDAGLKFLEILSKLQAVRIDKTRATSAGVGELQNALPNAGILGL
jgi:hypothetical protein